ncbi:ATP-binding protein [Nocardioides speluncae]|uniref:ATP-binding protein n=1 Tax=Nocardioides speluncae TaxID=2670337 RepID=UPI000D68FF1C|nr:ATP-binding protein [Nocardioides speluncae]
MIWWWPSRWPLRVRVALAFLGATMVALAGLGTFVQLRMADALDERLRDTVAVEADRLAALPASARLEAVRALGGEVHAQVLTGQGEVEASSQLVAGPIVDPVEPGYRDSVIELYDDDAAQRGDRETEREAALLLVRATGDGYLVVGTSREDTDEARAQLRGQLLVGGPLALLVAGGLGYVVAGVGLRPVERIRARAATISGRSAGERLPLPDADDELRRMAVTLNAMLDRLDEGLLRERRFAAEAGHELRTPLTLMRTEIELALAQPRAPEELTRALGSLHDEVLRLIALAENVLQRAAPDHGGLPIEAGPVDLSALATRIGRRFQPAAGERAITVRAPRPVEFPGDELRLDRALSNLVDNALRHGAGEVEIEVRDTGEGAVVMVTDEGGGFPPDDPLGAGLGLSIVREIAQAHGGRVDVRRVDGRTGVHLHLASP